MESNTSGISGTNNLHFAAYLDASGKLTFVGAVRADSTGRVLFRFRDPKNQLGQLFEEYASGASVPAIDFSTSLRTMRRAISTAVSKSQEGEMENVKGQF